MLGVAVYRVMFCAFKGHLPRGSWPLTRSGSLEFLYDVLISSSKVKKVFHHLHCSLSLSHWLNDTSFFQLQASGGSSSSPSSPAAATPPAISEVAQPSAAKPSPSDAHPASEPRPQPPAPSPSQPQPQPSPAPVEEATKDTTTTPGATTAATTAPVSDRHSPATPQPARTPGSEEVRSETTERTEGVAEWVSKRMTNFLLESIWFCLPMTFVNTFFSFFHSQVKKSTLNPNAKEFNPIKPQMPMVRQFIPAKSWKCTFNSIVHLHSFLLCTETISLGIHLVLSRLKMWKEIYS